MLTFISDTCPDKYSYNVKVMKRQGILSYLPGMMSTRSSRHLMIWKRSYGSVSVSMFQYQISKLVFLRVGQLLHQTRNGSSLLMIWIECTLCLRMIMRLLSGVTRRLKLFLSIL